MRQKNRISAYPEIAVGSENRGGGRRGQPAAEFDKHTRGEAASRLPQSHTAKAAIFSQKLFLEQVC